MNGDPTLKKGLRETVNAGFNAGRLQGYLDAIKILVRIMDRSDLATKTALMNACEEISALKSKDEQMTTEAGNDR